MSEFDFHDCPECGHDHELPSQDRERLQVAVAKVGLKSAGEQIAGLAKTHAEVFKMPYTSALQHVLRSAPNLAQAYLDERRAVRAAPGST